MKSRTDIHAWRRLGVSRRVDIASAILLVFSGCSGNNAENSISSKETEVQRSQSADSDNKMLGKALKFVADRNGKSVESYMGTLSRQDDGRSFVLVELRQRMFGAHCIVVFDVNEDVVDVMEGM